MNHLAKPLKPQVKPNLGIFSAPCGNTRLRIKTRRVAALREGQTQLSFALVSDSPIDADQSGSLSVNYQGTGANAQSATSNSWAITVTDAGEPDNVEHPLEGDYLVKTETYTIDKPLQRVKNYGALTVEGYAQPLFNVFPTMGILNVTAEQAANTPSVTVLEKDQLFYVQDSQGNLAKGTEAPTIRNIYNDDGEVTGTEEIPSDDKTVTDNTLFGSAGKDKINGKTGHDLIDGQGGNDQIDGGAGSDNIKGGDGNDRITSSSGILAHQQQISETDQWVNWGLPDGKTGIGGHRGHAGIGVTSSIGVTSQYCSLNKLKCAKFEPPSNRSDRWHEPRRHWATASDEHRGHILPLAASAASGSHLAFGIRVTSCLLPSVNLTIPRPAPSASQGSQRKSDTAFRCRINSEEDIDFCLSPPSTPALRSL